MTAVPIPFGKLCYDKADWPRDALDPDRVALFVPMWKDDSGLPPVEVVALDDGRYLICDGVHRSFAARQAGRSEVPAIVIEPLQGESPRQCAYRRALETATRSALPLTRTERRRAVLRLLETRPDLSHRAIAELVGVAHSSVDKWAKEAAESASDKEEVPPPPTPTAEQTARRLVGFLVRFDESRGVLDYLAPSRMGRHLARAFEDRFGGEALKEAQRFAQWTANAHSILQGRGQ